MGLTYTVMADTIGMVMHNSATAQQGMQIIGSAATTTVCSMIIAVGIATQD
jgi:hypothetical protein